MNVLIGILLIAYSIRTLFTISYHLFWWEKKEYRFDRMLVHLRETYQGKRWMFGPLSLIKWFLLFLFILSGIWFYLATGKILFDINHGYEVKAIETKLYSILFIALLVIYLLYLFEALKIIIRLIYTVIKFGWDRKHFKLRRYIISVVSSFVLISFFIYFSIIRPDASLLVTDKLLPFVVAVFVGVSNLIFHIYKNKKIEKAKLKIKNAENLRIIGITGSYGKTTTKELISQLLSNKYKVLKTLGSQNTDIGIAERILGSDLSKHDFFVCEMAAYKIGEIKQICQMLIPRIEIGIITGINEQHQSLFKSLENTKKAKFELIEALAKNGTAIFNAKSNNISEMIDWAKDKKLKSEIINTTLIKKLPPQIHGHHFQENLSLAISGAKAAGMNEEEIKKSVSKLKLPEKTMNIVKKDNLTLIDDTFNANPDGVYAAIEHLREYEQTKILVLQPLIELGNYSKEVHNKIGRMAAEICDVIILTNKNFNSFFIEGVNKIKGGIEKVKIGKMPHTLTDSIILFEGKEAEKYFTDIKYKK